MDWARALVALAVLSTITPRGRELARQIDALEAYLNGGGFQRAYLNAWYSRRRD